MIFTTENNLPKFMKNKWKIRVVVGIVLLTVTILFAYWQIRQFEIGLIRGPDLYEEMDLPITHELLDSAAVGLRKYHEQYGHYPKIEGKYFFDSIRKYINIPNVYIYVDSMNIDQDTIFVKNRGDTGWTRVQRVAPKDTISSENSNNFHLNYQTRVRSYLGVGMYKLTIIYRHIEPDSFFIYSIGKNLINENGKGDDIVYKKNK